MKFGGDVSTFKFLDFTSIIGHFKHIRIDKSAFLRRCTFPTKRDYSIAVKNSLSQTSIFINSTTIIYVKPIFVTFAAYLLTENSAVLLPISGSKFTPPLVLTKKNLLEWTNSKITHNPMGQNPYSAFCDKLSCAIFHFIAYFFWTFPSKYLMQWNEYRHMTFRDSQNFTLHSFTKRNKPVIQCVVPCSRTCWFMWVNSSPEETFSATGARWELFEISAVVCAVAFRFFKAL